MDNLLKRVNFRHFGTVPAEISESDLKILMYLYKYVHVIEPTY